MPDLPAARRLPMVNHWSDVVANIWEQVAGDRTGNLKNIFKQNIHDPAAIDSINKVLGDILAPARSWPGRRVYARHANHQEWYHALLGSSYGAGVSNMLMQHVEKFGQKGISYIQVWTSREGAATQYHMNFELG